MIESFLKKQYKLVLFGVGMLIQIWFKGEVGRMKFVVLLFFILFFIFGIE